MWSASVRPAAAAAAEADSVINNMHRYDHGVGPQVEGRDGVCVSLELRVYLLWNLFYFSQSVFDAKKVDWAKWQIKFGHAGYIFPDLLDLFPETVSLFLCIIPQNSQQL